MQKTIRTLTIIATALAGFSLILMILSFPFQRVLACEIFDYPDSIISALPIFPFVPFLTCLLRVGCIALLIIFCRNKKYGVLSEILMIIVFAIVLPLTNNIATSLYHQTFLVLNGSEEAIASSIASRIASYCCYPANWGQVLAYTTCGMSIAFKTMSKKQSLEQ